jgi:CyaY protein
MVFTILNQFSTAMTENEFNALADATLERLARAIEERASECECESKADGVLELEFADRGRIIVNRHSSAQQIWVAAKSGGHHFRWDGAKWVNTRDGTELFSSLSNLVSAQSGRNVTLD